MILFAILAVLLALCVLAFSALYLYDVRFVRKHSKAIAELLAINAETAFHSIPILDMEERYDSETNFETVSPRDYLIYHLVYKQRDARAGIALAEDNRKRYDAYTAAIRSRCRADIFDTEKLPPWRWLLRLIERRQLNAHTMRPSLCFFIYVTLLRVDMRGRVRDRKQEAFAAEEILDILTGLRNKSGDFYRDASIWDAICRVERARVSNKMRFAIYERDGYRCCSCHRKTNDLEIDHIFPISKGGKSIFSNLQTLCHRCNAQKSNYVVSGLNGQNGKNLGAYGYCAACGAPLVRKRGRSGEFYGCPNYPQCKGK